jgi:uncharacterized protein (TIGR02145 family)
MKTIGKSILLITLTLMFFNCTKDKVIHPIYNFNYSTFTDSRDGKIYKYIKIGTQEWMAENLDYKTASGSWNYGDVEANGDKYGRLYTWDAAKQAVPLGWHLPTDAEWKQLEIFLGMSQIDADNTDFRGTSEGTKLKSTNLWPNNGNGTDDVGFSAIPGGFRPNSGDFFVSGFLGYWWTATETDQINALFRVIKYNSPKVFRNNSFKGEAFSVRCVKD